MRGHKDNVDRGIEFDDPIENLQPVQPGHCNQVGEHDLRMFPENDIQALFRVAGSEDLNVIRGQGSGEQFKASRIVVDYDD